MRPAPSAAPRFKREHYLCCETGSSLVCDLDHGEHAALLRLVRVQTAVAAVRGLVPGSGVAAMHCGHKGAAAGRTRWRSRRRPAVNRR